LPLLMGAAWLGGGCGRQAAPTGSAKPAPPAKVENAGLKEADLAKVTLTAQAAARLGIELAEVEFKDSPRYRTYAGEIVLPPGQALQVTAPVAGTVSAPSGGLPGVGAHLRRGQAVLILLPLVAAQRDLRASIESEVAAAQARAEAARTRAARAERMLRDETGSVKALEAAREELKVAEAALAAARTRLAQIDKAPLAADVSLPIAAPQDGMLRRVEVAPGQLVPAGAPLFELARLEEVWIRVPVYAGEAGSLRVGASAEVRPLNVPAGSPARRAPPVEAPPSADPVAATVDLYYRLDNRDLALRPGEKLSVTLPLVGRQKRLQVPFAAVVYDVHGGAWVYENTGALVFVRRRIEVDFVSGSAAVLERGPPPGTKVVAAGAAELFGTEFGAGK
jgi:RND family efflux transporter MFP subunit